MHGGVRISYMHFSFTRSTNLGHASWNLKVDDGELTIIHHHSPEEQEKDND